MLEDASAEQSNVPMKIQKTHYSSFCISALTSPWAQNGIFDHTVGTGVISITNYQKVYRAGTMMSYGIMMTDALSAMSMLVNGDDTNCMK